MADTLDELNTKVSNAWYNISCYESEIQALGEEYSQLELVYNNLSTSKETLDTNWPYAGVYVADIEDGELAGSKWNSFNELGMYNLYSESICKIIVDVATDMIAINDRLIEIQNQVSTLDSKITELSKDITKYNKKIDKLS